MTNAEKNLKFFKAQVSSIKRQIKEAKKDLAEAEKTGEVAKIEKERNNLLRLEKSLSVNIDIVALSQKVVNGEI